MHGDLNRGSNFKVGHTSTNIFFLIIGIRRSTVCPLCDVQFLSYVKMVKCDVILGDQSKIEHVTFSVFYLIEVLTWRGTFCWNPHLNWTGGSKVMSNWRILRIESKRYSYLFRAISHNQCPQLSTDSARSQHKCQIPSVMFGVKNWNLPDFCQNVSKCSSCKNFCFLFFNFVISLIFYYYMYYNKAPKVKSYWSLFRELTFDFFLRKQNTWDMSNYLFIYLFVWWSSGMSRMSGILILRYIQL